MLWNELLRKGNVSLLQSQSDTQYCVCRNYDPKAKEDQQYDNGSYFCYFDNKDQQVFALASAIETFRYKTEENYITRSRLEELATEFKDRLIEADEEFAKDYFPFELEDYEMKFFEIETEDEEE